MKWHNGGNWNPRIDYQKAFYDPAYGHDVNNRSDDHVVDDYSDNYDYDDDDDITAVVRSMSVHDSQNDHRALARNVQQRPHDHSYQKKVYSEYLQNPSTELSEAALDFAKRFIDMLTGMQKSKSHRIARPTSHSALPDRPRTSSRHRSALGNSDRNSPVNNFAGGDKHYDEELSAELCQFIYNGIIGIDAVLDGPFGPRHVVYCDFVASGKPLKFIEQYIKQYVLPTYANTHSDASDSAVQTNKFREEAREIIRECVNGTEDDIVIFTGSGSTAAIAKMIQVLKASNQIDFNSVVVMVAVYEHHSNLLSWENAGVAAVIKIPLDKQGTLDLEALKKECQRYHSQGYIIIGSISAASNVTGIVTNTTAVAEIIHYYDGYAFFDYACGAPYLTIDMNPSKYASKDAVFISVHKFVGGPQSPGLLIGKKFLFTNVKPTNPAGGTVTFVSRSIVQYVEDPIVKEEGGTPEIVGSIRAGLAFRLKSSVSERYIHKRERELVRMFMETFRNNPLIKILGMSDAERLAIFSFVVRHPSMRFFVHHNFVGLLLNDLFGIQSRPGCACAGPYAMDLLDVPESMAHRSAKYFTNDCGDCCSLKGPTENLTILKQGFVRVNLPYFYPQKEIDFIVKAVKFVVEYGWCFLPQYTYATKTGFWMHRFYLKNFNSLKDVTYSGKAMNISTYESPGKPPKDPFESAYKELENAKHLASQIDFRDDPPITLHEGDAELRWFMLPHEAAYYLMQDSAKSIPSPYPRQAGLHQQSRRSYH